MWSCASLTGSAAGPTRRQTRPAIPRCTSWICLVAPAAASPASSPRAAISSRRMDILRFGQLLVGLGQALDAFLDLLRGDAGISKAQARLGTVEHEVRALHEQNAP